MSNSSAINYLELHRLEILDYVVFVFTLLVSLVIGFYYAFTGGRQKTQQEYLLGDKKMGVFPVTMSLLASFLSAMGMITLPAEIYMYDAGLVYSVIGMTLALPVVAMCYMPTFYDLQLTSAYEYLELRFNSALRKVGSFSCIMSTLIYVSFVLYAPSLSMSQVTGLNLWGSVIAIGVLGTIYTTLGGIKAVMWTDVFQLLVVFISLITSITKGVIDTGGMSYVWNKGIEGGRLSINTTFDMRIRYTIWTMTIAEFFKWLGFYGIGQMMVQRYVSSESKTKARMTIFLNLLGNGFFQFICLLAGLVIYAKYWNCDPLKTKMVNASDQLLPLFVIETLHPYPGMTGLFIAGLFSGSLSTISSALNSLAAMTLEDFIKSFKRWKNLSSERAAIISKILTVSFGVLSLAMVPLFSSMGSEVIPTNSYNSHTFLGITFALFTLGMFVPWANSVGATVAIIVGFVFSQWMSIGSQLNEPYTKRSSYSTAGCVSNINSTFLITDNEQFNFNSTKSDIFPLYQIAFSWIMSLSAIPTLLTGIIVSAIYHPTKLEDLNIKLLSPIIRWVVRKYWPEKIKEKKKIDRRNEIQTEALLLKQVENTINSEINYHE